MLCAMLRSALVLSLVSAAGCTFSPAGGDDGVCTPGCDGVGAPQCGAGVATHARSQGSTIGAPAAPSGQVIRSAPSQPAWHG